MNSKLEKLYYNPENPGSFSGFETFYLNNNKEIKIPKKKLKAWFESQEAYTLHQKKRKNFPRNKFIVSGINDTLQGDLIDISKLEWHNNAFKWLLVLIDIFSKKAWVVALKNKTNSEIVRGLTEIFSKFKEMPKRLQTDQGLEFLGKETRDFLKKLGIHLYFIHSDKKAAIVERFNRTLKEKMWRFFSKNKTKRYIDDLDKLVESYNNTFHRAIRMKPNEVSKQNESSVFFNLYGENKRLQKEQKNEKQFLISKNKKKISSKKFQDSNIKFRIGDLVRISKNKHIFEKGYTANWSSDIFSVFRVNLSEKITYKLKDQAGELLNGIYYKEELQKVFQENNFDKIEKIIRTRKSKKNGVEYLVKWTGLSSDYNTWTSTLQ